MGIRSGYVKYNTVLFPDYMVDKATHESYLPQALDKAGAPDGNAALDVEVADDVGDFIAHRFEGDYGWFGRPIRNLCEGYIDSHFEAGIHLRIGVEAQYQDWLGYLGPPIGKDGESPDVPPRGTFVGSHIESSDGGNHACGDEIYVFVVPVKIMDFKKEPITVIAPIWFQRKDVVSVSVRELPYFLLNRGLVEKLPRLCEWKVDARGRFSISFGKSASKVVQCGTEVVQRLPGHHTEPLGWVAALNKVVSNTGFGFIINREFVGVTLPPFENGLCKVVDLFLGPLQPSATPSEIGTSHVCL